MSDKTFADQFGVSEKTISRALTALEAKGLIKRETKNVRNGKERHIYLTNRQNDCCIKPTDNLTVVQGTNCPLPNGQKDLIKDNSKKIITKEKLTSFQEVTKNLSNSDGSFKM